MLFALSRLNVKTKGLSGREALPHPVFWLEVKALVQDGATFAIAKAKQLQVGVGSYPIVTPVRGPLKIEPRYR